MWEAGLKSVDMAGGSKLSWADEELGLTPTGAWLEVVVGSGTPPLALPAPYTDPGGLRWAGIPQLASVPSSYSILPTPTPKPLLVSSTVVSLGVPFHSDSNEDSGILDFSSLLKKR